VIDTHLIDRKKKEVTTPVPPTTPIPAPMKAVEGEPSVIGYFWDYENCPVGKQYNIFDVVKKLRSLNIDNAQERGFTCFNNSKNLAENVRKSLHQSNVMLQDIPDTKPNAVDRAIFLALTDFQSLHKKATIGFIFFL
jgi:hypothetical protein